MKRIIEEIDPKELTVERIRKMTEAFNFTFERNGGVKGYELQCIEALLAEIDRLSPQQPAVQPLSLPSMDFNPPQRPESREQALERALRYWLPDETLIPAGHEHAWNEHVELIPEHRRALQKTAAQGD